MACIDYGAYVLKNGSIVNTKFMEELYDEDFVKGKTFKLCTDDVWFWGGSNKAHVDYGGHGVIKLDDTYGIAVYKGSRAWLFKVADDVIEVYDIHQLCGRYASEYRHCEYFHGYGSCELDGIYIMVFYGDRNAVYGKNNQWIYEYDIVYKGESYKIISACDYGIHITNLDGTYLDKDYARALESYQLHCVNYRVDMGLYGRSNGYNSYDMWYYYSKRRYEDNNKLSYKRRDKMRKRAFNKLMHGVYSFRFNDGFVYRG